MQLYNIKTGEMWNGEPIDARGLLDRGGWQDKPIQAKAAPAPVVEEVEEPKPVKRGRKKA
jgi:hypothetical protein